MALKQRVADGVEIAARDVRRLLRSSDRVAQSTNYNYYLLRDNGEPLSAKSIVFQLNQSAHHKGNQAAEALMKLGFQIRAKRRSAIHDTKRCASYEAKGLLVFDGDEGTVSKRERDALLSDREDELEEDGDVTDIEVSLRAVAIRRGQRRFRAKLLNAYGGRCAVTSCDAEAALEAAHIRSFAQGGNNRLSNGILLRADLHTLFDLALLGFEREGGRISVVLHLDLQNTSYGPLNGRVINLPANQKLWPHKEALRKRLEEMSD